MNKKLIWVNLILLLLVVAAYIFHSYIVDYPMMFNLPYIVKESRLEFLAVIFAFTALVSYLISSLDLKKLNFRAKFLRIFPIINGLVLLFFICLPANEFLKTQREISERENNSLLQAKKDIENDNVILQYTSGISIPIQNPHTTHRIDSIQKKYGITYINTGCIIDPIDNKAQKKYADAVAPFLEKRNGRNWQNRMQKEIDHLKEISDK